VNSEQTLPILARYLSVYILRPIPRGRLQGSGHIYIYRCTFPGNPKMIYTYKKTRQIIG